MKKLVTMAIALVLVIGLLTGTAVAEGKKIGICVYQMTNTAIYPLFQSMIDSVVAQGDEYVFVSGKSTDDTESIVNAAESLVARDDIDGILCDNINDTLLTDVFKKAKEKNIPVVCNDIAFADESLVVANVLNDNYSAGLQIAERCVEDLGGKGNVILFVYRGNEACRPRTEGIYEVFDKYPDINVLYEGMVTLDVAAANATISDLLMSHPEVDAILSIVDNTTIGGVAAAKMLGRTGIKFYSIDGSVDICPLIKSGDVQMSVAQDFVAMGNKSAEALYAYMNGETVEPVVKIDAPAITIENVDEWIEFFASQTYTFAQ